MDDRKVVNYIGKAGDVVEGLLTDYNKDSIEAVCVCVLKKDGTFHISWDAQSRFLDRIGMATTLVHDLYDIATHGE